MHRHAVHTQPHPWNVQQIVESCNLRCPPPLGPRSLPPLSACLFLALPSPITLFVIMYTFNDITLRLLRDLTLAPLCSRAIFVNRWTAEQYYYWYCGIMLVTPVQSLLQWSLAAGHQLLRYKIRVQKGSLTVTVQESSVCAEQLGRQRSSYLQMRYLGHVTENEFVRMFSGV